jgi:hypothetical protein
VKLVILIFTWASLGAGLIAAWYWYRASKVFVVPMYATDGGGVEPVDPFQSQSSWTGGILLTVEKTGRLNKVAAQWTAGSVALGAAANTAALLLS